MEKLILSALEITQFRNLAPLKIDPSDRFNVISGRNGSGKTNLLEAIYFFSTLRSFRTLFRKEIIQDDQVESKLFAQFMGAAAGVRLSIHLSHVSRVIKKDEKEISSLNDHFYNFPMVLFHPANMSLIQGGPKERRRFMDRALFQADRVYPVVLADYNRALSSRNALLKSRPSKSLLFPYDQQLANLGSRIVSARQDFIEKSGVLFSEALTGIGDGLVGSMIYRPDVPGDSSRFLEIMEKNYQRDLDRGFSGRGPHADELEILVGDRPAKRFASQGQQRMAVLSMKIAEVMTLAGATQCIPILLLDDISSELDRDRNLALFSFLNEVGGQVFITTTHLDHVRLNNPRSDFLIDGGCLSAV